MRRKNFRLWWRRLPALIFASTAVSLAGCDTIEDPADDCEWEVSEDECDAEVSANPLRPGWYQNQEFHLETTYYKANRRSADGENGHDLSDDAASEDTMAASANMTDPVFWRYQVIRQDHIPAAGDDFYEYSTMGGTVSPITVIKASLDPIMNIDEEFLEADPKAYLVIREDRLRLAGVVLFHTNEGQRISDAVTIEDGDINKSYNVLSQMNLSVVPQLIPPFPMEAAEKDVVLEDGQVMSTLNATTSSVDVIYENSMDGTLISETWAEGQPWALFSETSTTSSRLMDPAEVDDIRGGVTPDSHDEDDLSFTQALRSATKLTDALNITAEMIGNTTHEVGEGHKPWAGYWWAQAKGNLVFGIEDTGATYTGVHTISHLGKQIFKTPGTDVQNIGDALRDIRKEHGAESDEYTNKVQEYRDAQQSLVDNLVKFYNAVRTAIDGGRITVTATRISADVNWNQATGEDAQYGAFDFEIDRLSPFDKYALVQQLEGRGQGNNPWFIGAWELLNHWSPAGSGWFGHCNGWAAAAILMNEPREAQTVEFELPDGTQATTSFSTADLKGLASETHYSGLSHFFGTRYNDEEDDVTDLSPKSVLQLLEVYVNQRGVPFVFDTTATDQVWNFPVWKYTLNLTETTEGGSTGASGLININTAGQSELETLWGISTVRGQRIIAYRQANGPFQTAEDIINVSGIGRGIFNRISEFITVSANSDLRSFTGSIEATFAADGVAAIHVDTDVENPRSFQKTWAFSMEASPAGEIISSSWVDNENHPDFGWTPYANTVRSGNSENPFLNWTHLKTHYFADDAVRQ